jgi:hypothetical protein
MSSEESQTEAQQTFGAEPSSPQPSPTVWVVAANYPDDPHPHVEGVYNNRETAEEHEKELREPLGPSAWGVHEMQVASEELQL